MNTIKELARAWVAISVALTAHVAETAFFTGLGDLPGGRFDSVVRDISGDGSTVVGVGWAESGYEAFRWTASEGMVGLGYVSHGGPFSRANAASTNGSVVAGGAFDAANVMIAIRWDSDKRWVALGDLPGGPNRSEAFAVSADGAVLVGSSSSTIGLEAFRWTFETGMIGLGDFAGGPSHSTALGISGDGSVTVGYSHSGVGREAFRWTSTAGMVGLGDLPGGIFDSIAYDISANGSVVVGRATVANGREAYRWNDREGMVGLGHLPGPGIWSTAQSVSADGSIVVGQSLSFSGNEAFIWDVTNGMRSLQSVLADEFGPGSILDDWTLTEALGISYDGHLIVGNGINPVGHAEAWIANLRTIPIGDTNNDGRVSLADLNNVRNHFGADGPSDGTLTGDTFPFDGLVNVGDLNAVLNNFGAGSEAAAVPEPSGAALTLLAAIACSVVVRWRAGVEMR